MLVNIWEYCDNETLLAKLNQLSSGVRTSILSRSIDSSEASERRSALIDLSRFIPRSEKFALSYFAQCVIDHFEFKFKMEPSVREANYDEKLEEEWVQEYGEDWDLVHYEFWVK